MKKLARAIAPFLITGALFAASALPVAAAEADGSYARFADGSVRGLIITSYSGTTTVSAGVLGLIGSTEYFVIGRSIGCNGQPSTTNRAFRIRAMTDANGALVARRSPDITRTVRSVWLMATSGIEPPVCAISFNYAKLELVGDWDGDGAVGILVREEFLSLVVVEKRPDDRARVSTFVHGLEAGDDYSFRGVTGRCGRPPGQAQYTITMTNTIITSYRSTTVDLTQDALDSLRSVRIRNTTENSRFGCVPLGIIAILIS